MSKHGRARKSKIILFISLKLSKNCCVWGGGAYGPSRPLAPRSLTVAKRAPKEEAAFLNSEGRGEKLKVRLIGVVGSVVGHGTVDLA